jgi:hypothetical protein
MISLLAGNIFAKEFYVLAEVVIYDNESVVGFLVDIFPL